MKTSSKMLAVGVGCAACCLLPFVIPLLAGSAVLTFLSSSEAWYVAALLAMGIAGWVLCRRQPLSCTKPLASCGCGDAMALDTADTTPIRCTLTPGDFRARASRIRDLSARTLQAARREDLQLHLSYTRAAAAEVHQLVREEQACCEFLQFDIREDSHGIHVVITVPEEACGAADLLFAQFAPDLAQHSHPNLSKPVEVLS
jgi:hypothetical protein